MAGSNALFGISAQTISQKTGIHSINLGLHAGLGGEYILRRAEKIIKKGDIILLPLEYPFYSSYGISDDFKKTYMLNNFMVSYDKTSLRDVSVISLLYFTLNNAFLIAEIYRNEYATYFQGHLSKKEILERLRLQKIRGDCYSGLTLNSYGDETCNIGKEDVPVNPEVLETAIPLSISDIDPGNYIKRFVQFSKNKGAIIIPLFPVSTYTNDYKNLLLRAKIDNSANKIKKFWEDQGIEFQDSLNDSLLPPKLMYNSKYHPRDSGRQKRTKIILNLVGKWLKGIEVKP